MCPLLLHLIKEECHTIFDTSLQLYQQLMQRKYPQCKHLNPVSPYFFELTVRHNSYKTAVPYLTLAAAISPVSYNQLENQPITG